jgi:hypothetical protein
MEMFFTPSRKSLSNVALSEDSVLLEADKVEEIMAGLSSGKLLDTDIDGNPVLKDPSLTKSNEEVFSELPLKNRLAILLTRLNKDYDKTVAILNSGYPEAETQTWTLQVSEARVYQSWIKSGRMGKKPSVPFLERLVEGRIAAGVEGDLADLVGRVLHNDGIYSPALAGFTAYRHGIEKQLKTAVHLADEKAFNVIEWHFKQPAI